MTSGPERRLFPIAILLGAMVWGLFPAAASSNTEEQIEPAGEENEVSAPVPRRPPRYRPDPEVSFPEPLLPGKSQLPVRDDPRSLDAFLGPIPKEVVVAEGSSLAEMRRISTIPNTRLGFATIGGNTLTPEDVRRLSRLPAVHLYFEAPLEAVHVEVVERIVSLRAVTVRVPAGMLPEESLPWRISRLGAARRDIALEGEPDAARLEALAGLTGSRLTIQMPADGLGSEIRGLLEAGSNLAVRVPPDAQPAAIEGLRGLRIDNLVLQTEGNRLRGEVLDAAVSLEVGITVLLDRRLGREDLRRLKGIPRLKIVVWLADSPGVPASVTDLLLESEGIRAGLRAPKEDHGSTTR